MTDQHPPHPDEPDPPETGGDGDNGRNQWAFEAPDPSLSFHGDRPTDPDALADRPTGAAVPPPGAGAGAAAGAAAATPSPPAGTTEPADPNATRVVDAAPPLATPAAAGSASTNRVGTRTAAIMVGIAALIGLGVVAALAFTGDEGDDDGEVMVTEPTPDAETTPEPTAEPTPDVTPTPEPTPEPTATPLPLTAATDLATRPAAFGGEVTERWDLDDGRLTSTIEIAADTDDTAAIDGLYVVVLPTSITTDLATVTFDPEPTEVVEADDPAAAFAVAVEPDDPPVTIVWSTDVDLAADETPDAALERLVGDRAAAEFRFAADTPDLTIGAPDDGSTTIGSSVTLRGQTDAAATVTVNGDTVDVGDNGRFRTDIERTRDTRRLTIIATDPYGRSTEVTWTVRFADPAPTPTPRPVVVPTPVPVRPTPVPPPPPPPTSPPVCPPTDPDCR